MWWNEYLKLIFSHISICIKHHNRLESLLAPFSIQIWRLILRQELTSQDEDFYLLSRVELPATHSLIYGAFSPSFLHDWYAVMTTAQVLSFSLRGQTMRMSVKTCPVYLSLCGTRYTLPQCFPNTIMRVPPGRFPSLSESMLEVTVT